METTNLKAREIWLIRHGVSVWNLEQIHQGQSLNEPGLASEGKNQAACIGKKLQKTKLLAIYASPLPRTLQTARIINGLLEYPAKIIEVPGLKEINHGIADGMGYREIVEKYPQGWQMWLDREMEQPCFPSGESQLETQTRMVRAMHEIMRMTGKYETSSLLCDNTLKIAVVAHGGVNKLFLAHALGLPPKANFNLRQENACINILTWDGEKFAVKTDENGNPMINLTDHLGEYRLSPDIRA